MDSTRTFEVGKWGSHNYCHCTISKAELSHNSHPINFEQFRCLTDRHVTLANNTKLVRWECDGTITFTTPGIDGTISMRLSEIHYFSEEKTPVEAATNRHRPRPRRIRSVAMLLLGALGLCLLVVAIYLRTHS